MTTDLQEHLLEILKWYHNFCEKHKLKYYAIGGTFLGAVRHKGFIPWDDDIDVAMPRPDYERFILLMSQKEETRFRLETPESSNEDYLYTVSKLYDTSTTVVERVKTRCRRGVFLDIFPIDGIGKTPQEVSKNYKKIYYKNLFFASRTSIIRASRVWWKNLSIIFSHLIPSYIINDKKFLIALDKECSKISFSDSKFVGVLLTQYGTKYIMEKSIFEDIEQYSFEGQLINGVKDYEKFLTLIYGKDWRCLPPENKRLSGHDFDYVNLKQSYLSND